MNSRDGHRRTIYKILYKKYLFESQKVADHKKRNKELNSKNNELCKRLVQLREEVRKSSSRNSMMKAEIYDLARDRKKIVDKNKKLYDTLASLHQDASAIDKRLGDILRNSSSDKKFQDSQNQSFSLPTVNGIVIQNPKANLIQPETNYPRYNFKDCTYVQDLSPVMEENAEVNKLTKPSDITRRLGHRGKVPQPHASPGNFEMGGTVVCEEDNSSSDSHYTIDVTEPNRDINNLEKRVLSVDSGVLLSGIVGNSAERFSSVNVKNELNSTNASESMTSTSSLPEQCTNQQSAVLSNGDESAANMCDSPILTINVLQKSECEKTHNSPHLNPSAFVNVFPRRKKPNNLGCSLSVGSIEEEDDTDSHQEPNNTFNENEDSKCSYSSKKSSLDQSGSESQNNSLCISNSSVNQEEATRPHSKVSAPSVLDSIIDKSWIDSQNDPSDMEFLASDKRNKKKTSKASLKSSVSVQDITESSEDGTMSNEGQQSRTPERDSPVSPVDSSPPKKISTNLSQGKNNAVQLVLQRSPDRISDQSSVDCSPPKKALIDLSQGKKNGDQPVLRRSSDRITDNSPKKNIPIQKAPKSLQKKKIDYRTSEKRSKRSTSNKSSSAKELRDVLHNETDSEKVSRSGLSSQEVTIEVDKKKLLRSKKPINFVESPVNDKKRQKGKRKTKSRAKN